MLIVLIYYVGQIQSYQQFRVTPAFAQQNMLVLITFQNMQKAINPAKLPSYLQLPNEYLAKIIYFLSSELIETESDFQLQIMCVTEEVYCIYEILMEDHKTIFTHQTQKVQKEQYTRSVEQWKGRIWHHLLKHLQITISYLQALPSRVVKFRVDKTIKHRYYDKNTSHH